jgi:hypothetical protein
LLQMIVSPHSSWSKLRWFSLAHKPSGHQSCLSGQLSLHPFSSVGPLGPHSVGWSPTQPSWLSKNAALSRKPFLSSLWEKIFSS